MQINGIAHMFVTVSRFEETVGFYRDLLELFGMKPVLDGDGFLYCVGGRTAFGVQRCGDEYTDERFVQNRVGLHHVCFRAREREDVDTVYAFIKDRPECTVVHEPEEGEWAPGYYSLLFEDLDGIRLEVNYVPGKGLLKD